MSKQIYLAHISEDKTREQSLIEHLDAVAAIAERFASAFGCGPQAKMAGKYHDLGKGSEAFMKRLLDDGPKIDHATAGAQELDKQAPRMNRAVCYCVAGHHSGLLDGGTPADVAGTPTLHGRLKKELEDYSDFLKEMEQLEPSIPPLHFLGKGGFSYAFYTRMLFSCLVDADFLDTERFMSDGTVIRPENATMEYLRKRMREYIQPWLESPEIETVNGHRTEILKACIKKGQEKQGLYQLTVPTGGGKTISSLAFALEHAVKYDLEHILYVIPYTSIIEQNADVFRKILGKDNVLEDHCNVTFENSEELKAYQLAAENYDKKIIVTTNVQFFESLFSNKTSKCRKLHNFAKSVIVFDEAQMLPTEYLLPCIRVISELVYNYQCTAVLCTATQPALIEYFPKEIANAVQEICPDVEKQYQFFKRTKLENLGTVAEAELTEVLEKKEQVLCILNTRKRAQRIYTILKNEGVEGIFHLSTLMYPQHRKSVLKEIKERLTHGKSCRVIATSLIEAGVDVDFPIVFREFAGIDSMIQAAGRCNREGTRPAEMCTTYCFNFEDQKKYRLPHAMKLPIAVAEQIACRHEDITGLEAIQSYFTRLYNFSGDGLDTKNIVDAFEDGIRTLSFPFETVSKEFRLIEEGTKTVLIPLESKAKEIEENLRLGNYNKQLMRDAGRFCVNIYEHEYEELFNLGNIEEVLNGFAILIDTEQYEEEGGLQIKTEMGFGKFI